MFQKFQFTRLMLHQCAECSAWPDLEIHPALLLDEHGESRRVRGSQVRQGKLEPFSQFFHPVGRHPLPLARDRRSRRQKGSEQQQGAQKLSQAPALRPFHAKMSREYHFPAFITL